MHAEIYKVFETHTKPKMLQNATPFNIAPQNLRYSTEINRNCECVHIVMLCCLQHVAFFLNNVDDAKHYTTQVHTLNILWMILHKPSTFKQCSQVPSEIRGMEQTSDKSSAV